VDAAPLPGRGHSPVSPTDTLERTDSEQRTSSLFDHPVVGWMVLLIGFSILTRLAFRGWIPHDDGTLAQAASRVLDGETPHVDFHDTYGGLQAYAHAGAFQLFGESLRSLRLANLVVAAIAALSSFALVRRVQPPVVAATVGVTLLLVGFAVYPASMPSWWNAALGVVSAYLVMRWLDSRRVVFLLAAGAITGISFLVKSTAAYAGAGIALFLLMLASQSSSNRRAHIAVGATLVLVFAGLLARSTSFEAIVFMLLPLSIVVGVGFRKQQFSGDSGHRDVSAKGATLFALSAAAPVLIFAVPYVRSGNAEALIIGWFRLPQLRFDQAAWGISLSMAHLAVLALLAALVFLLYRRVGVGAAIGTCAALLVVVSIVNWDAWWGLVLTFILVAPLGISAAVLGSGWRKGLTREQLLCALMLATFAFIQFPQANSIYALYLVPWIVTVLGVWFTGRSRATLVGLALLVSAIVAIQLERDLLYISSPLAQPVALVPLDLVRGGIEVPEQHRFYVQMAEQLQPHAGSPIYAGPDSPEIYFLSATMNPTPVLFDFLAWDWGIDERDETIRDGGVTAVVVNRSPDFSSPLPERTLEAIEAEFPDRLGFGWFDVYENRADDD